jgi:hypothetical protein
MDVQIMDMKTPETELTIRINNKFPVELLDLTNSFLGFADEFQRYILENDLEAAAADTRLYVKEIKAGSIIAELIVLSPQLIQGVSYANTAISFVKNLKTAYDYLIGNSEEKPDLEKATLQNLNKIIEPIAKDSASQINIGDVHGNVVLYINSTQANAAQNNIKRLMSSNDNISVKLHEKVLLYIWQARADVRSKTGDRGIIESISPQPVKIVYVDDGVKSKMILDKENPFNGAYIVDVGVETIKGKVAVYRVIALHEIISKDEIENYSD